jgi:hypothetical protein
METQSKYHAAIMVGKKSLAVSSKYVDTSVSMP